MGESLSKKNNKEFSALTNSGRAFVAGNIAQ